MTKTNLLHGRRLQVHQLLVKWGPTDAYPSSSCYSGLDANYFAESCVGYVVGTISVAVHRYTNTRNHRQTLMGKEPSAVFSVRYTHRVATRTTATLAKQETQNREPAQVDATSSSFIFYYKLLLAHQIVGCVQPR